MKFLLIYFFILKHPHKTSHISSFFCYILIFLLYPHYQACSAAAAINISRRRIIRMLVIMLLVRLVFRLVLSVAFVSFFVSFSPSAFFPFLFTFHCFLDLQKCGQSKRRYFTFQCQVYFLCWGSWLSTKLVLAVRIYRYITL